MFLEHVPEAKMFPRLISNSGKRKIRKNRLAKFLEFFSEIAFLDFDFTKGVGLALSRYTTFHALTIYELRAKFKEFKNSE